MISMFKQLNLSIQSNKSNQSSQLKSAQTTDKVSKLEYKNIINSIFNGTIPSRCVQYQSPSRGTLWYFYSPSYLLITSVLNNFPHGRCYLYSCPDIQLRCIARLLQGEVKAVTISSYVKVLKKKSDVLDDNTMNNTTSEGEIYSTDQTLVYKGDIRNGRANGIGRSYYTSGVCSYYGMWKQGKRHGFGIEYDDQGRKVYEVVWIDDNKAVYQDSVTDMNAPQVKLSQYPFDTRVMYIKDDYYQNHPLVITGFPFLECLFISSQSYYTYSITVKDLPCLKKCVVEKKEWSVKKYYIPFVVRSCPLLKEVWLNVSFDDGMILVNDKRNPSTFNKRFVLQELQDTMNWKKKEGMNSMSIPKYRIRTVNRVFVNYDKSVIDCFGMPRIYYTYKMNEYIYSSSKPKDDSRVCLIFDKYSDWFLDNTLERNPFDENNTKYLGGYWEQ